MDGGAERKGRGCSKGEDSFCGWKGNNTIKTKGKYNTKIKVKYNTKTNYPTLATTARVGHPHWGGAPALGWVTRIEVGHPRWGGAPALGKGW